MKRVLAVSRDKFLLRKIELTLDTVATVQTAENYTDGYDVCLYDVDTVHEEDIAPDVIRLSRTDACDIRIPFGFSELVSAIENSSKGTPELICNGRVAYIRSRKIKLTELEAALLSRLILAKGEFVSREDILHDIWGDGCDGGIVNVYIHYLREKLEDGEKIIISSRKHGYKIDGRYI